MQEKRKIWHWLVLALLSLIWGSSYILMKKGLESFSTYQIAGLRVLITFLSLLPIALRNLPKLSRENFRSLAIIGIFGSGIPAFLFPLAETKIDSSLAGMLNSLSPVFTLVLGIMFYKQIAIKSQIAGVFLGLLGAVGLLYSESFTFNFYGLYVVLATFLYSISTNEVSRIKDLNGLQITSLAFLILSPFAVILLLTSDYHSALETEHWVRNLGFIAILSVVGTSLALALFYLLVRDTSPVFGSMVTYFIPIVASFWGIADNEHFTHSMILSLGLIIGGVYLINRPGLIRNLRRAFR
jgi:drug/metabolite transporter (DMT)-like permease